MVLPWLVFFICHCIAFAGALNDEGLALLSFKESIEKNAEGYLSNWNSSDLNPCSWHGVTCREDKVVYLNIPGKKLTGLLSPTLGKLSALQRVNLRDNNFHGTLPVQLFDTKGLQSLVLSGNLFSGPVPPEIGNYRYLQTLDLSQNSFNGSVPSSLLQCKRLKMLVLSQNNFTGSLPDGFGTNLSTLQKLNLSFNSLSGSIPDDMGNLSSLKYTLDLSHNYFNGPIPASLGDLPEDVYIDLSHNNLSGPIPQKDALVNAGPEAFSGNPLLCGLPLHIPCPPGTVHTNFDPSQDSSIKSSRLGSFSVVISVVGAVLGVCLVGFMFSYWYKKASGCKRDGNTGACRLEEKLTIRKELLCFMKRDLETLSENMEQYGFVPLDSEIDFDLDQLLKASAFLLSKTGIGIVYKVVLDNGATVAVRRLGDGGWQRFKEFQTEVEAIGKVRHPNVVSLRAYCWSADEKLLIYDYIPNGDLASAIHGKASTVPFKPLSWPVRLRIMRGIARGLTYLHEFSPKRYVHGDLKPTNILLGENMEPHISDFGLGRLANISEEVHSGRMLCPTPPQSSPYEFTPINSITNGHYYQAPEASRVSKPSQKWDVYSYGVILLEMISGKLPIFQIGPLEMDLLQWIQVNIEEKKPLSCIIDPFLVQDLDLEDDIAAVLKISLGCVCKSPDRRPSMRSVSESLDKLTSSTKEEFTFR